MCKNTVNTVKKKLPSEQCWTPFFKEVQSQRGGNFVGIHFRVCVWKFYWIMSGLCWAVIGSCLGISLVVWGFIRVIVGHFKPMQRPINWAFMQPWWAILVALSR